VRHGEHEVRLQALHKCTFCRIINLQTTAREALQYLFDTCPVTSNLLRDLTPTTGLISSKKNTENFPEIFWFGIKEIILI
jgi:hypothetical protein